MPSDIKPEAGKWYKGKNGEIAYVRNTHPDGFAWVSPDESRRVIRQVWPREWILWATAGPFDTREEAERA